VLVRPQGEHAFITDHTRLPRFERGDLSASLLDGADAVFFNGYGIFGAGSTAFVEDLLAEARRRRVPVAFDPSSFALIRAYGASRLLGELSPLDILIANDDEARALASDHPPQALQRHCGLLVVKQGAKGSSAFTAASSWSAEPFAPQVVDTTGAGDAFDAAFLVHYLRNKNVEGALNAANRLGAHVASFLGAQPPVPDWMAAAPPPGTRQPRPRGAAKPAARARRA
jgi:sugar/nucleoside kinase (ribokinase family)